MHRLPIKFNIHIKEKAFVNEMGEFTKTTLNNISRYAKMHRLELEGSETLLLQKSKEVIKYHSTCSTFPRYNIETGVHALARNFMLY